LSHDTTPCPRGGGTLDLLVSHIHDVRRAPPVGVPRIRDEMIDRLVRAIVESNDLAKQASGKAEKGQGGVPTKAHWYRFMGYEVRVLDSVYRNVEVSELNEPLRAWRMNRTSQRPSLYPIIDKLEQTAPGSDYMLQGTQFDFLEDRRYLAGTERYQAPVALLRAPRRAPLWSTRL
jgi:hypothetical protein